MDLRLILWVAVGGAAGSVSRYAITWFLQSRSGSPFPIGTLLVNVTGSLILGFLMRYLVDSTSWSAEARLLLTTGFCGGFTTFSTFTYETARLLEDGDYRLTGLYVGLSVVLALAGALAGITLARWVLAARHGMS